MSDRVFRYSRVDGWLKGNTHIHTTRSDGGKSPEEVVAMYGSAGYDFVFLTDHWVASLDQGDGRRPRGSPLVLDGIELDGKDEQGRFYHVVCLGTFRGIDRDRGLEATLASVREQGGFLVLAHPFWTGNSVDDALAHPFHAVEAYNHVCSWLNGKGSGLYHWDAMLERRPEVLGLAVDDAHISLGHPGWNGGWVMVGASARTPEAILGALRSGLYYSSCGPEVLALELREKNGAKSISCRSSPVSFARLVGPRYRGQRAGSFDGATMTEFELPIPDDFAYARLEIEDPGGRRAWTNTLFTGGNGTAAGS
jgi:hypothetical protein